MRYQFKRSGCISVSYCVEQVGLCLTPSDPDNGGNRIFGDIGVFLRKQIQAYFEAQRLELSIKYIDPSYMIRSMPACASDSIYCARLGANAVHAAMTGRTACLVGRVNNLLVHVPIGVASQRRNRVDPEGALWRDVVNDTGQPLSMTNS